MLKSTDKTLEFLMDLIRDGVDLIRREIYQQVDDALVRALAVEFPPLVPVKMAIESTINGQQLPLEEVAHQVAPAAVRLRRSRQFTSGRIIRELRKLGFVTRKASSGHRIFVHPGKRGGHVAVPHHSRDLPRGTLSNILRQATQVLGVQLTIDPRRGELVALPG